MQSENLLINSYILPPAEKQAEIPKLDTDIETSERENQSWMQCTEGTWKIECRYLTEYFKSNSYCLTPH